MKIPVTLLSAYIYCPRKLFLEQVLLLEEPPKESIVLGSIRHETYELINKKEEDIIVSITKNISLDEIKNIYRQNYLKILRNVLVYNKRRVDEADMNLLDAYRRISPFIIEESAMRSLNISNFIKINNVFGDELWHLLTPKIISELRVESDNLKLKGVVDQVHVYENEYVPFELKTGRMPADGVWPSHRIQLAAYSMLLKERFRKQVKEGYIYYLDSKSKRHLAINPFMEEEGKQVTNEVIELLEKKRLPDFCKNEGKCRKCGLRETCHDENKVEELLRIKINIHSE